MTVPVITTDDITAAAVELAHANGPWDCGVEPHAVEEFLNTINLADPRGLPMELQHPWFIFTQAFAIGVLARRRVYEERVL